MHSFAEEARSRLGSEFGVVWYTVLGFGAWVWGVEFSNSGLGFIGLGCFGCKVL